MVVKESLRRVLRKRASKLSKKAAQSLSKIKGDDLKAVSNRASLEQYVETLAPFAEPQQMSPAELARSLAADVVGSTEQLESEQIPRFIQADDLADIDCGSGCAWCCHEPLQVSILDAISVACYLLDNPNSDIELEKYLESLEPYGNERAKLKESFQPCPFLDDSHRCRVYQARPVICRAFHSRDVGRCRSIIEDQNEEREVPMYTGLFGFRGLRLSGARKALKDLGLDDRPVVLARAVKLLLADFEGVTQEWLEGEEAFEPAIVRG